MYGRADTVSLSLVSHDVISHVTRLEHKPAQADSHGRSLIVDRLTLLSKAVLELGVKSELPENPGESRRRGLVAGKHLRVSTWARLGSPLHIGSKEFQTGVDDQTTQQVDKSTTWTTHKSRDLRQDLFVGELLVRLEIGSHVGPDWRVSSRGLGPRDTPNRVEEICHLSLTAERKHIRADVVALFEASGMLLSDGFLLLLDEAL
jgi:hypothetical protein